MKKFEIINDKWIKEIPLKKGERFTSMKIKSIALIDIQETSEQEEKDYHFRYSIQLIGGSNNVYQCFKYKTEEVEQFNNDLKFLENLIYNQ